ncbi:MAG: PAS domain S-box protein [Chloroflexi bacterium]|nr:PAS domain S-box protein [Chloroflexota bacterium]
METTLTLTLDAVAVAVLAVQVDQIVFANTAATTLTGYPAAALDQLRLSDLIHPEDPAQVPPWQALDPAAPPAPFAAQLRCADGSRLWVNVTLAPHTAPDQPVWLATLVDIDDLRRSLAEHKQQNALYTTLASHFPNGMVAMFDHNLRCLLADGQVFREVGANPPMMIGHTLRDLFPPEVADRDEPHLRAALAGEPRVNEVFHIGAYYRVITAPVYDADGTIIAALVMTQDITKETERLQALNASEARFRSLFESAAVGIFLASPDFSETFNNPALMDMLGYEHEEIQGRDPQLFRHLNERQAEDNSLYRELISGQRDSYSQEHRLLRKDGSDFWVRVTLSLIRDAEGAPHRVMGIIEDIDERKRAEEALRQSEAKLRLITDNMLDMVNQFGPTGQFEYISPSHERVLGFTPDEMRERSVFDLLHPDDIAPVRQRSAQAAADRRPYTIEYRVRRKDGNYIWLETTIVLLFDNAWQVRGGVTTARDETARREAETALEVEQALSSMKSKMMMRISHEFRTPLATIRSSSDLLERYFEKMTSDQRRERFRHIKAEIRRIAAMLDDLTQVVHGQNNTLEIDWADFNLDRLCQSVIENMCMTSARQHNLTFHTDGNTYHFSGDEQQITNALGKLITNAVIYSPPGSAVRLRLFTDGDCAALELCDEGVGIHPDDIADLFEPFFRGRNIGEVTGIGLGLSIVKYIVELHHGSISVASELGQGACFTIRLPLSRPAT